MFALGTALIVCQNRAASPVLLLFFTYAKNMALSRKLVSDLAVRCLGSSNTYGLYYKKFQNSRDRLDLPAFLYSF